MKIKSIIAALMAATIFLSGCQPREVVDRSVKVYEVVGIKPPKRFKVDLRDVETGKVYKDEYVSKRCASWKKLEMGSKWKLTQVTYKNSDGVLSYSIVDVHSICQALSNFNR